MNKAIRVMVVDDCPDIHEILGYVLSTETSITCVAFELSAEGLCNKVRAISPDVLLLDARMPGQDAIDAIREIAAQLPDVRTIIYSGFDDPALIDEAIDAGAWGWVKKGDDPQAVIDAVKGVAAGRAVFPRPHARLVSAR